jgi:hypothetical protein
MVNIAAKRVLTRARPDRMAAAVPAGRQVRIPFTASNINMTRAKMVDEPTTRARSALPRPLGSVTQAER